MKEIAMVGTVLAIILFAAVGVDRRLSSDQNFEQRLLRERVLIYPTSKLSGEERERLRQWVAGEPVCIDDLKHVVMSHRS